MLRPWLLHHACCTLQLHPTPCLVLQVLFVHTGGLLGMYDKAAQLQPLVEAQGRAHRLKLD